MWGTLWCRDCSLLKQKVLLEKIHTNTSVYFTHISKVVLLWGQDNHAQAQVCFIVSNNNLLKDIERRQNINITAVSVFLKFSLLKTQYYTCSYISEANIFFTVEDESFKETLELNRKQTVTVDHRRAITLLSLIY